MENTGKRSNDCIVKREKKRINKKSLLIPPKKGALGSKKALCRKMMNEHMNESRFFPANFIDKQGRRWYCVVVGQGAAPVSIMEQRFRPHGLSRDSCPLGEGCVGGDGGKGNFARKFHESFRKSSLLYSDSTIFFFKIEKTI
ncbi:MAG: hypothetical protein PUC47_04925 [Oscillospiraceae bacterium]|nr:hypothetical protein [Oscillospiraceae bacterium]